MTSSDLVKKGLSELEDLIPDSQPILPVVENSIYFYTKVDDRSVAHLTKEIKILENRLLYEKISRNQDFASPINLYIFSEGGCGLSGMAAADTILNCKVPIHTIVSGYCASAATFLSVSGRKRFMTKNSIMLIHQLSDERAGTYYQLKDDIKNLDLFMNIMRSFYRKHTKIPSKKLNEILKHDLSWTSDICLKYGLVDEIL